MNHVIKLVAQSQQIQREQDKAREGLNRPSNAGAKALVETLQVRQDAVKMELKMMRDSYVIPVKWSLPKIFLGHGFNKDKFWRERVEGIPAKPVVVNPAPAKVAPVKAAPVQAQSVELADSNVKAIANMTLESMNKAETYQSGANIGYQALDQMNANTNESVRSLVIGGKAARAATNSEDAYHVLWLTFAHVNAGRGDSTKEITEVALAMLNKTKDYSSGAQVGYAVMAQLRDKDPNEDVRTLARFAHGQAMAATNSEDAFNTLFSGIKQINAR